MLSKRVHFLRKEAIFRVSDNERLDAFATHVSSKSKSDDLRTLKQTSNDRYLHDRGLSPTWSDDKK